MQVDAGADALQIFDSWAGHLEPQDFHTIALPYLARLVKAIKPTGVPIIIFCRGSHRYLSELIALEPAAIGFDYEVDLSEIAKQVPSHIAVQGNLNPELLNGPLSSLEPAVNHLLDSMQDRPGFIFNLGHGIEPLARIENVQWLVGHVQKQKVH